MEFSRVDSHQQDFSTIKSTWIGRFGAEKCKKDFFNSLRHMNLELSWFIGRWTGILSKVEQIKRIFRVLTMSGEQELEFVHKLKETEFFWNSNAPEWCFFKMQWDISRSSKTANSCAFDCWKIYSAYSASPRSPNKFNIFSAPFISFFTSNIAHFEHFHPYIQHENRSLKIKFGQTFILFIMWIRVVDPTLINPSLYTIFNWVQIIFNERFRHFYNFPSWALRSKQGLWNRNLINLWNKSLTIFSFPYFSNKM